jgi:serine/threonine-protein kinase RsbT
LTRPGLLGAIQNRLENWLNPATAETAVQDACLRASLDPERLEPDQLDALCQQLDVSLHLYLDAGEVRRTCDAIRELSRVLPTCPPPGRGGRYRVMTELDATRSRKRALDLALQAGFGDADAVRVATVASELARNILQHAGCGSLSLAQLTAPRRGIVITAEDQGPGIPDVEGILEGELESRRGAGLGLFGSRRLVDELKIETGDTGTRVTARKYL